MNLLRLIDEEFLCLLMNVLDIFVLPWKKEGYNIVRDLSTCLCMSLQEKENWN